MQSEERVSIQSRTRLNRKPDTQYSFSSLTIAYLQRQIVRVIPINHFPPHSQSPVSPLKYSRNSTHRPDNLALKSQPEKPHSQQNQHADRSPAADTGNTPLHCHSVPRHPQLSILPVPTLRTSRISDAAEPRSETSRIRRPSAVSFRCCATELFPKLNYTCDTWPMAVCTERPFVCGLGMVDSDYLLARDGGADLGAGIAAGLP